MATVQTFVEQIVFEIVMLNQSVVNLLFQSHKIVLLMYAVASMDFVEQQLSFVAATVKMDVAEHRCHNQEEEMEM